MADLVLHGGVVFDGEKVLPGASAVAVRDGRVLAVGSDDDVRAALSEVGDVGGATRWSTWPGRLVLPGFTDAHVHPVQGGVERLGCDLTGATSAADTLERVRRFADAHPELDWVVGGGWLKEYFDAGLPTAAALDQAVPDRPVMLRDNSHHAVWVNSEALRRAGVPTSALPDPGHVGTLHEEEMDLVAAHVPEETRRRAGRRPAGGAGLPAQPRRDRLAGRDRRRLRRAPRPDAGLPGGGRPRAAHRPGRPAPCGSPAAPRRTGCRTSSPSSCAAGPRWPRPCRAAGSVPAR